MEGMPLCEGKRGWRLIFEAVLIIQVPAMSSRKLIHSLKRYSYVICLS